jgi:hypothetical protein
LTGENSNEDRSDERERLAHMTFYGVIDTIQTGMLILDGVLIALSVFYVRFLGWAAVALLLTLPMVLANLP